MNTFTGADGFNPVLMKDLVKSLLDSADCLGLADCIAERIRTEVSVNNLAQIKESLVADMMASTLNAFVNDFGYSLFGATSRKIAAREIAEQYYVPLYNYIDRERTESYAHDELSDMFERVFESGDALIESFDNHYNEWIEYMTVAFIVHLKRSDLSPEANRALGNLINAISF